MSGNNSALASLTATYTDSEDEEEEEIDETDNPPFGIISAPASPHGDSNSRDASSAGDSGGAGSRSKNSLGLVSYQDDQIDDEAIDDYQSDSTHEAGEEKIHAEESSESRSLVEEEVIMEIVEEESGRRIKIPSEPSGKSSVELQEKITKLYERKQKGGLDMNEYIQRNKNFRNPSIYEKLIKHCNIDELGTNYPPEVYDPHEWGPTSYYDELAKVQKAEMERREKEKKDRTKVEFVSGTVKKTSGGSSSVSTSGGNNQTDSESKRKSKWDQRGVMPTLLMPMPVIQPVLVQPTITTSVTGTKTTVISAFGNLPKKTK